jgi:hypothetical protein
MVWAFATRRTSGWVWGIIGVVLFFGGLANFFIFWHVSVMNGGSPSRGKVEDGRFYLSSHGRLTEVSEASNDKDWPPQKSWQPKTTASIGGS